MQLLLLLLLLDEEDNEINVDDVPDFTEEELFATMDCLRNKKAPGPDGIQAEIIRIAAHEFPVLLMKMYNTCIRTGDFSRQ